MERPVKTSASRESDAHSGTFELEKLGSSQRPSIAGTESVRSHGASDTQDRVKDEHVTSDGGALEAVVSAHPSVRDPSVKPDGGKWAWLQVLGGFFLLFNSWYVAMQFLSPTEHQTNTNRTAGALSIPSDPTKPTTNPTSSPPPPPPQSHG
jgi:hypothetical protein